MLPTIRFNRQPPVGTVEIQHILPDPVLPSELGPLQLAASKDLPQPVLRIGRLPA